MRSLVTNCLIFKSFGERVAALPSIEDDSSRTSGIPQTVENSGAGADDPMFGQPAGDAPATINPARKLPALSFGQRGAVEHK